MRIEATSRLLPGSIAVAVWVDLCGSIPISIIVGRSLLTLVMGGSTADNPTSRNLAIMPLLSQAADGHRWNDTPKESQPQGRQEVLESVLPVS
jgi:hypothetical protein